MNALKIGLLDEIKFWRELMLDSGLDYYSDDYKRMNDALELAKMRLKQLLENEDDNDIPIPECRRH